MKRVPPTLHDDNKRLDSLAQMRCTKDERDRLNAEAERAGITVSAYMRHQCLNKPPPRGARRPPVEREHLARLLGQLGKCGGNLNQIAKDLNTGLDRTPTEIAAAVADIRTAALAISAMLRGKEP